jgi:predicted DCC family thiol-disulfide oxidoreductase YuxK
MLRHDTHARLLFAPLHHPLAAEVFARYALDPQQIDSVVLVSNGGGPKECVALRSDAILGCLGLLGGGWALLAGVARIVPRVLRDVAYNWLARNRRLLFPSDQTCILPTPAERVRFYDG